MDRSLGCEHPLIQEVARYIILSGGKRIRPILTVAASRLFGGDDREIYRLSVVPEYLHAASLLHDDVVDEGELRRGKPPAYRIWGNRVTILSGDYLYARAIEIASTFKDPEIDAVIARTVKMMAEGEIIQLVKARDMTMDLDAYYEIVERKTGALIASSCAIGAILGGAQKDEAMNLWRFGDNLGKAFQIVDDCLDYCADEGDFGKAIGTDLKDKKITMPLIHAFRLADTRAHEIHGILEKDQITHQDISFVSSIVWRSGAIEASYRQAQRHIEDAIKELNKAPPSPTRDHLEAISKYILTRRR